MAVKSIKIVDIPTSDALDFDTKMLVVDPTSQITRLMRVGDVADYVSEISQNTANLALVIANNTSANLIVLANVVNELYEFANTTSNVAIFANTTAEYANTTANYANNAINDLPYGVVGFYPGAPTSNAVITLYVAAWDINFTANLSGSKAICVTTATSNTDFSILKNGSQVGTLRYVANSTQGIFLESSSFSLISSNNDILQVKAPEVADATLTDIAYTLAGTR